MLRNAILMVLAVCFLSACNQPAPQATPKIGIIDTARVFRESEPAKTGVEFLEGIQADMQKQLTDLQEKMQQDPENVALQQEIQTMYTEFQQRIGAEEQNVVNLLQDSMQRTITTLRTNKKLDLIVGAEIALSYDKALDITSDVIAEMNKVTIEFKPVVPETPAMSETPMQAPAETPAEAPATAPAETPTEAPTTDPAETPTEAPATDPAAKN